MNQLAAELNDILGGCCAGRLLSSLGSRLYFPKGIIAQSGEAKKWAKTANGTIGMAFQEGRPFALSAAIEAVPALSPAENVTYAPTAGFEPARMAWKDAILAKNPSIQATDIGMPVLVPGITAGLSYVADLFLDKECTIITSDPSWDNYRLIFEGRREAAVNEVPYLNNTGLDLEAIRGAITEEAKTGSVRVILNFPNNPSGYTPTKTEAEALAAMIHEAAKQGADCLVICDDAYFGFFYEDTVYQQSLFGLFSGLHERVLAVKIDGPTKEDYMWGWRVAFVTFSSKGLSDERHDALVKKMMGAIRSSVSCANTPAQNLLVKTMSDPRAPGEKKRGFLLLKERYLEVKKAVAGYTGKTLAPLPFNSGYFMCFRCSGVNAEVLRITLLHEHGIGVVSLGDGYIRVAFASLDREKIAPVFETIFKTADMLAGSAKG